MSLTLTNGFITADLLVKSGGGNADALCVVSNTLALTDVFKGIKTDVFFEIDTACLNLSVFSNEKIESKKLYVNQLPPDEKALFALADFMHNSGAQLMVRAASTLEEVGLFDAKFGLSPVMLLHRLGLLTNNVIVSGVWLDKEDAALMQQEEATLVLLPSSDFGSGNGIPPTVSFLNAGVNLKLGTAEGQFNPLADLYREAYLLQLGTSATMNKAKAITDAQICGILTGKTACNDDILKNIYGKS